MSTLGVSPEILFFALKGSPFPKLLERTLTGQPASKKGQPQFRVLSNTPT